jgi:hypothetical protein
MPETTPPANDPGTALALAHAPAPTSLTRYYSDLNTGDLARAFAASGYFADTKEAAQAIVKIQAGRELGVPPIAAMTGIHIVKQKIVIGATVLAGLIRRSGRYDYQILEHTDEACTVRFFRDGAPAGDSRFTLEDAKAAQLLKADGNWEKHPRNMLFARALSNGQKWYAPDITTAPLYTPGELGPMAVDTMTGETLDADLIQPPPKRTPPPATNYSAAPAPTPRPGSAAAFYAPPTTPPPADPTDDAAAEPPHAIDQAASDLQGELSRDPQVRLAALIDRYAIPTETQARWLTHFGAAALTDLAAEEATAICDRIVSHNAK